VGFKRSFDVGLQTVFAIKWRARSPFYEKKSDRQDRKNYGNALPEAFEDEAHHFYLWF
jgi:hypothetical protein